MCTRTSSVGTRYTAIAFRIKPLTRSWVCARSIGCNDRNVYVPTVDTLVTGRQRTQRDKFWWLKSDSKNICTQSVLWSKQTTNEWWKSPGHKQVETKYRDTTLERTISVSLRSGVGYVQMEETERTYYGENDQGGKDLLMRKTWTKNTVTETYKTIRVF